MGDESKSCVMNAAAAVFALIPSRGGRAKGGKRKGTHDMKSFSFVTGFQRTGTASNVRG